MTSVFICSFLMVAFVGSSRMAQISGYSRRKARRIGLAATRITPVHSGETMSPNVTCRCVTVRDVETAARAMGLQIQVLNASNGRDIDTAFTSLARDRPDALFVGGDQLFTLRHVQLVHLASRHGVPATFGGRRFAEAGGLMTYGTNTADSYRQTGVYVGRILKGAKPADLPVEQSTK